MGRPDGYTTMQLKITTLALFNQTLSKAAWQGGESTIEQDQFLGFLLNIYRLLNAISLYLQQSAKK